MNPILSMGRFSFKVVYPRPGSGVDDYIEIRVESDGSLTLRGHDGRLVVRPDVSNKLNISLEKYT
jgi:hypothetical protein